MKNSSFWHYKAGKLYFGKKLASHSLKKLETPCYLYDAQYITQRYKEFEKQARQYFKSPLVAFAVKANPNQTLLTKLGLSGCGADVVSIGEVQAALKAGIPPQKIIFSGVGKTRQEFLWLIKNSLELFSINVESLSEIEMLEELAREHQVKLPIALRLNPEVMAKTHKSIATGAGIHKFGIALESAEEILPLLKSSAWLELKGISMHIGSQLTDAKALTLAVKIGVQFVLKHKLPLKFFDVGGGLGIAYLPKQKILPLENYMKALDRALAPLFKFLPKLQIAFEPGRFIVGPGGLFITRVIRTKFQKKERFVIVDGAMNDFMRPALYQAKHQILIPEIPKQKSLVSKAHVAGPVCESTDVFSNNASLPELAEGDFLLFADCGAYGRSMSSTYNCRPLPKEYFLT